jgi:hypothetical protein
MVSRPSPGNAVMIADRMIIADWNVGAGNERAEFKLTVKQDPRPGCHQISVVVSIQRVV